MAICCNVPDRPHVGRIAHQAPSAGLTECLLCLSVDVLEAFRRLGDEQGRGYQTLINETLREALRPAQHPVDAKTLWTTAVVRAESHDAARRFLEDHWHVTSVPGLRSSLTDLSQML